MRFVKSAVLALSALALAIGSAYAADKPMDNQSKDGKITKKEVSNASRSDDSGFAKLDKNKDGYISKAEAMGDARLKADFDKFDLNNDGKLNRAEYLAAAAKEDVNKVGEKISGSDKDKSASGGASSKPKKQQ